MMERERERGGGGGEGALTYATMQDPAVVARLVEAFDAAAAIHGVVRAGDLSLGGPRPSFSLSV